MNTFQRNGDIYLGMFLISPFFASGCSVQHSSVNGESNFRKHATMPPLIFVEQVTPHFDMQGGLLLAVWKDGTILKAALDEDGGISYSSGMLDSRELAVVTRQIGNSSLPSPGSFELVLDYPIEFLTLRSSNGPKSWSYNYPQTIPADLRTIRETLFELGIRNPIVESNTDYWRTISQEWKESS